MSEKYQCKVCGNSVHLYEEIADEVCMDCLRKVAYIKGWLWVRQLIRRTYGKKKS